MIAGTPRWWWGEEIDLKASYLVEEIQVVCVCDRCLMTAELADQAWGKTKPLVCVWDRFGKVPTLPHCRRRRRSPHTSGKVSRLVSQIQLFASFPPLYLRWLVVFCANATHPVCARARVYLRTHHSHLAIVLCVSWPRAKWLHTGATGGEDTRPELYTLVVWVTCAWGERSFKVSGFRGDRWERNRISF